MLRNVGKTRPGQSDGISFETQIAYAVYDVTIRHGALSKCRTERTSETRIKQRSL